METKQGSACDFRGERENLKVASLQRTLAEITWRCRCHRTKPLKGQVPQVVFINTVSAVKAETLDTLPEATTSSKTPHPPLVLWKAPGAGELPRPPAREAWVPFSPQTKEQLSKQRTMYCASSGVKELPFELRAGDPGSHLCTFRAIQVAHLWAPSTCENTSNQQTYRKTL